MNYRLSPPRSLFAALTLTALLAACSSSSSGGANGQVTAEAQNNPAGTWVVTVQKSTNCGAESETLELTLEVSVNGGFVDLRDITPTGSMSGGTLENRSVELQFPSIFQQLLVADGLPAPEKIRLTFNQGFTTVSGSSSDATEIVDDNFDLVPCVVTTSVSGRRVACSVGGVEEIQVRVLLADGTKIGTAGIESNFQSGCAISTSTLSGAIEGNTFAGKLSVFGVDLADFGIANPDLLLEPERTDISFNVVLKEPGQVSKGTWSGTIGARSQSLDQSLNFPVSGTLEVTLAGVQEPVTPEPASDCLTLRTGRWVMQQFANGIFIGDQSETLTQEGCLVSLGGFTGTLGAGGVWIATSGGGDTISGTFGSTQSFTGQGTIEGIAVEIVGAFVADE